MTNYALLLKAKAELELRQRAQQREAVSPLVDFTAFKREVYRRYIHAPHLQALDAALMQVCRYIETAGAEGIGRLVIEMPPRHGKTMSVSKLFPPYFLGRHPDWRMIGISYGADLAEKSSRFARNLMASPVYQRLFPGVRLAPDSASAASWDIAGHEGGVDAVGIGGAVTGKGAQLLNIDDLIKNREQAESATWRDKIWDSYTDDLYTRLEPGGAVIVTGTRWHVDDHIGRLLKTEGDKWTRLRLPALAEADDELKRPAGAVLWPERYPLAAILDIQRTLGEYGFSALYQQRPVPAEGGIFKRSWFPLVQQVPPLQASVRFWDLAMSEKTSADYTAGVKIGMDESAHIYITDVFHERVDWGQLAERMAQVMLDDGPDCVQGIEEKGYMSRAVQDLNGDARLRGYAVFGYPKETDKLTNALPFAAKAAAGYVHVLDSYFTETFIEELCTFPSAEHDDQVDAASGAWNMLAGGATLLPGSIAYADAGGIAGAY